MPYTPGPWKIQPDSPTTVWGLEYAVAVCGGHQNGVNNARLIAATPDLLEALQALLAAANPGPGRWSTDTAKECDQARIAIAKALKGKP